MKKYKKKVTIKINHIESSPLPCGEGGRGERSCQRRNIKKNE
jgi:hypothetical protein